MALFAQYAMAGAQEALNDAGWAPKSEEQLEATVSGYSEHSRTKFDFNRVYTLAVASAA